MKSNPILPIRILFTRCFVSLTALFLLSGCRPAGHTPLSASGFYFNTLISVTIYDDCDELVLTECFSLCEKYETMFSATLEGSDIYRINHAEGNPCEVSEETIELLRLSIEYANLTDGIVDPTVYPVSSLWNFSSGEEIVPNASDITTALSRVDYRCIQIEQNTVTLTNNDAAIDLGFIAKGYIGEKLKEYLLSIGVENALINLGGNILTMGSKPDGSLYRIGIEMPFRQGESAADFTLSDCSIVTSGVYERCFEKDGILYHHLIDTSTGYPADNGLLSVTIFHPDSARADALSTTCFLLGAEEGLALVEKTEGAEAMFILSDYTIIKTSGLQ